MNTQAIGTNAGDKEYAILNDRLCDNYKHCRALKYCRDKQKGAIHLCGEKILIDKSKCVACFECPAYCGLFRIAKNFVHEKKLRNEFDMNPLTNADYQTVERFGCDVFLHDFELLNTDEIDDYITSSPQDKFNILEFVDDENELCPFEGISVEEILTQFPDQLGEYRKYIVLSHDADAIRTRYKINDLPAILLLRNGLVADASICGAYRVNINNKFEETQMIDNLKNEFLRAIGEMF